MRDHSRSGSFVKWTVTAALLSVAAVWLLSVSTRLTYAPNTRLRFDLADGVFSVAWNDMLGAIEGLTPGDLPNPTRPLASLAPRGS